MILLLSQNDCTTCLGMLQHANLEYSPNRAPASLSSALCARDLTRHARLESWGPEDQNSISITPLRRRNIPFPHISHDDHEHQHIPRPSLIHIQLPAGLLLPAILHETTTTHDVPRAVPEMVLADPGVLPRAPHLEALARRRARHGPILQQASGEAARNGRCPRDGGVYEEGRPRGVDRETWGGGGGRHGVDMVEDAGGVGGCYC